jgi:hypothetical protein
VALLLQASKERLTYREIAHILIETAETPKGVQWEMNGAKLKFHPQVCCFSLYLTIFISLFSFFFYYFHFSFFLFSFFSFFFVSNSIQFIPLSFFLQSNIRLVLEM